MSANSKQQTTAALRAWAGLGLHPVLVAVMAGNMLLSRPGTGPEGAGGASLYCCGVRLHSHQPPAPCPLPPATSTATHQALPLVTWPSKSRNIFFCADGRECSLKRPSVMAASGCSGCGRGESDAARALSQRQVLQLPDMPACLAHSHCVCVCRWAQSVGTHIAQFYS